MSPAGGKLFNLDAMTVAIAGWALGAYVEKKGRESDREYVR